MKRVKEWTLATFLESIHVFMPNYKAASVYVKKNIDSNFLSATKFKQTLPQTFYPRQNKSKHYLKILFATK